MAVTASCCVALGMSQLSSKLSKVRPLVRQIISRSAPFMAVATAGTLNVFLMRNNELR